jgi:hypothetical protein
MGLHNKGNTMCRDRGFSPDELKEKINDIESDIKFELSVNLLANYRKKLFDAYIRNGFTEKQALHLCKDIG